MELFSCTSYDESLLSLLHELVDVVAGEKLRLAASFFLGARCWSYLG